MHSFVMVNGMAPNIGFNSGLKQNRSVPIRFFSESRAGFFRRRSVDSAFNRSDSNNFFVKSDLFSKVGPIHSESKYGIGPEPFNSCEMSRKTLHPIFESTKRASTIKIRDSNSNQPNTGRLNITFTESFNVNSPLSYNRFIERIRRRLAISGRYVGGVPMLIQEEVGRHQYFHIVLMSNDRQITLRIRRGDLYLVAFQGAHDRWYEFQPQNGRSTLFPDTRVLPYCGAYPTDRAEFIRSTTVGEGSLSSAIRSLADPNFERNMGDNQQNLINLMIMFPEALRFRTVSDFVFLQLNAANSYVSITEEIDLLVHNWGSLSFQLRRSDFFASNLEEVTLHILSTLQAAAADVLGLALWSTKTPTKPKRQKRSLPDDAVCDMDMDMEPPPQGRQLVEIFSVQILETNSGDTVELYGKIQVVDGLGTQYIFNREDSNYISIRRKEYVPLTGPTRAISAFDSFYINVNLMDYYRLWWDHEVSNWQIRWNYFADNVYDKPLEEDCGLVALRYAVYSNAVTATVQVTLINGICGTIKAFNTLSDEPITLFNKDNKDYEPRELIPLLRSVVVVPLTSSIKVVANLSNQDSSSSDNSNAQGSVTFPALDTGTDTGTICGENGEVEVMVTWSSSWD